MNECYNGINIPEQITEPCGNTYISTSCVTIPQSLIYLDLPIGANQTQVNENIILALQASYDMIQELKDRILILEGN